jgi:hypothetical protein
MKPRRKIGDGFEVLENRMVATTLVLPVADATELESQIKNLCDLPEVKVEAATTSLDVAAVDTIFSEPIDWLRETQGK